MTAESPVSVSSSVSAPKKPTSIIYQDNSQNIFILDIPTSLSIAQCKFESKYDDETDNYLHILSSTPPAEPYGSQPEPKSSQARNRVLNNMPVEEQLYRRYIDPVVQRAIEHLEKNHTGPWCLPRLEKKMACMSGVDEDGDQTMDRYGTLENGKRKRKHASDEMESLLAITFETDLNDPLAMGGEQDDDSDEDPLPDAPVSLAPGTNRFQSVDELKSRMVYNSSSSSPCKIRVWQDIKRPADGRGNRLVRKSSDPPPSTIWINVPPESTFIWSSVPSNPTFGKGVKNNPLAHSCSNAPRFNLILADPPWPNRSVRRSAHYGMGLGFDGLMNFLRAAIGYKLERGDGIVGIWTTNSAKSRAVVYDTFRVNGLRVCEEWIWAKTTVKGQLVTNLDGLWRKPYEVLIWGRNDTRGKKSGYTKPRRRVIAAVPDLHSRKPNLKELIEKVFYTSEPLRADGEKESYMPPVKTAGVDENGVREYQALELFARNLTAGWWSTGNEVLRFNWEGWWAAQRD